MKRLGHVAVALLALAQGGCLLRGVPAEREARAERRREAKRSMAIHRALMDAEKKAEAR